MNQGTKSDPIAVLNHLKRTSSLDYENEAHESPKW